MTTIKTAVSIDEGLFRRVEELAGEMQVPRSRVFSLALEAYLDRMDARKITEILNEIYADGPTPEEQAAQDAMWRYHVERTKDDRW